ncbi:hypothetical protein RFI_12362 [Reticulomyxa filosa]|uniref:Uncharacterized protein n=1 Tax=Reticulomyxa filosa TaxID=46433 RepID=X6NEN8_RETFI|nr:hypothetical protein RFI_12362 [Reticulomyxa filosa]|eukprot:ETO24795.1 hypothetical protein RFI_12362 [Reticulomyxa filosa]
MKVTSNFVIGHKLQKISKTSIDLMVNRISKRLKITCSNGLFYSQIDKKKSTLFQRNWCETPSLPKKKTIKAKYDTSLMVLTLLLLVIDSHFDSTLFIRCIINTSLLYFLINLLYWFDKYLIIFVVTFISFDFAPIYNRLPNQQVKYLINKKKEIFFGNTVAPYEIQISSKVTAPKSMK